MDVLLLLARIALAAVFLVAGIGKLLDLAGSRQAMRDFGLPDPVAAPAGVALPLVEIAVAILLLPVSTARYAAIAGAALLLAFIGGIAYNLSRGRKPDCHCFGQIHSEPAGPVTLARNGLLAVVALFIAVFGWSDAGHSLIGWSDNMSGFDWLVLILGVLILAVLVAEGWFIVHMLGQNGRLLIRLDELEQQIVDIAAGEPVARPAAAPSRQEQARGLPVGSPAPSFKLEGIYGETMTLDALRAQGKPAMLVFSDPGCGPCNALLPDLAKWQKEHAAKLTIAILSRGAREANAEKAQKNGLSLVLLQQDREVSEAYKAIGTPSAVLVNPDGTIGSEVRGGAEQIKQLLQRATGTIQMRATAPQPPTNGAGNGAGNGAVNRAAAPAAQQPAAPRPRMGDPAPDFTLNDLNGAPVSLAQLKGQQSVLIFWSPTCGFCSRMADDIKQWEAAPQPGAPRAVIVTSGDVEANRRFGFTSTMLMDPPTETMRKYGTGGTPTAILIDEQGRIASQLRVGQPGVMSLLRGEAEPPAPAPQPAPKAAQVGEAAPAVKLSDLTGKSFDLSSQRGKKTMLLFWNPSCGFCQRMLDDLRQWEASRPAGTPDIVVVSTGTAEANAAQGIGSTVLLDQGFTVGRAYGASGTPSAILIDEQGRIASEVAVGKPKVMALAGAPAVV